MSPKVASVASALELADKFPSSVRLSSSSKYGPWSSVLQRTFDDVRITSHANSASVWTTVFAPQQDGTPAPNNSPNAQRFAITLLELTVDDVNRSLITQAQTAANPALAAWGLLRGHHRSNMASIPSLTSQTLLGAVSRRRAARASDLLCPCQRKTNKINNFFAPKAPKINAEGGKCGCPYCVTECASSLSLSQKKITWKRVRGRLFFSIL